MSPLKKKKLNIIRNKLDKIDIKLIKIIKERTKLVDQPTQGCSSCYVLTSLVYPAFT